MNDLDRDTLIVTMSAYAEASGEGATGIRAQIHAMINRHNVAKWYSGKTLAGTCLQQYALSAWNTTDKNRVRAAETPTNDPVFQICYEEAVAAMAGTTQDPTSGATHYYAEGSQEPTWVTGKNAAGEQVAPPATFTVQINHHLFFKDVA